MGDSVRGGSVSHSESLIGVGGLEPASAMACWETPGFLWGIEIGHRSTTSN